MRNTQAMLNDMRENNIFFLAGAGAPALLYGAGIAGPGSTYTDTTNKDVYVNIGTLLAPVWTKPHSKQLTGLITAAQLVSVAAGDFGHAAGVPLLAAPGAGFAAEFISLMMMYDFGVAAYTLGGNTTVNATGGAAITGLTSAANSIGNAADKVVQFVPLSVTALVVAPNVGFSLVTSAAFTNPGTATGVIRWTLNYKLYATGF